MSSGCSITASCAGAASSVVSIACKEICALSCYCCLHADNVERTQSSPLLCHLRGGKEEIEHGAEKESSIMQCKAAGAAASTCSHGVQWT